MSTATVKFKGIAPEYSRKRVTRAGNAIRDGVASKEDYSVLENWRASHAHVINTFQANLRRRTRGTNFLVGQRLKRRVTIEDKLKREPGMNLARMHDVAGCRVVFPNVESMLNFRKEFNSSRSKHTRITKERDQFNYLDTPKSTGYRGIHDVYKYDSYAKSAERWNGLSIEVQYRTRAQHAWATSVEIADLLTRNRGKFSSDDSKYMNFFRVCSEIIARHEEDLNSCFSNKSHLELLELYDECVSELNILEILSRNTIIGRDRIKGVFKKGLNTLLIYPYPVDVLDENDEDSNFVLQTTTIKSTRVALEKYEEAEREWAGKADVVLVRAEDTYALQKVFQNYFTDSSDFVKFVNRGLRKLRKIENLPPF